MSFSSRVCESLFQRGLRLLTSTVVAPRTQSLTRNFQMLQPAVAAVMPSATTPLVTSRPGLQQLLTPFSALLTQVAGFKVKGRLRRRCKDCYFVIRQQRHYVICPTHPRHKQMSMKKRDYKSWILTHATQSKVRPY